MTLPLIALLIVPPALLIALVSYVLVLYQAAYQDPFDQREHW